MRIRMPGDVRDAEADRQERDGGAEIGLTGDQRERHAASGPPR